MLGTVLLVDSADQSIVRGVATQIETSFHNVHDFQISLLASASVVINALVTMPAGYLADRWGRVHAIAYTVVMWSLVSTLGAAAPTFLTLLILRALLGFGQGITEPSANSLIADYYQRDGRGRAFSVQQSLIFLGTGLGVAISSLIGETYGWRAAYLFVSIPGLLVAFLVSRMIDPVRGESDMTYIGAELPGAAKEKTKLFEFGVRRFLADMVIGLRRDAKVILRIPTLRLTLVGVAAILFTVSAVGFWLPVFYQRSYHMTQGRAGVAFGLMVVTGGIPGILVGGRLADRLITKYQTARVVMPGLCAIASTTVFLISFMRLPFSVTISLHVVGFFIGAMAVPALRAGLSDVTPHQLRGTGFGAFNLTSVLFGSAAAPVVVGALSQHFGGNLRTAFIIVLPPVYIGGIFLLVAKRHVVKDTMAIFQAIMEADQEEQKLEQERFQQ